MKILQVKRPRSFYISRLDSHIHQIGCITKRNRRFCCNDRRQRCDSHRGQKTYICVLLKEKISYNNMKRKVYEMQYDEKVFLANSSRKQFSVSFDICWRWNVFLKTKNLFHGRKVYMSHETSSAAALY